MPPISLLGNDVVDLADPWAVGKARDPRFLKRVLSARELDQVAVSEQPGATLWALWAAKEAAYKAWSRHHPDLVLAPSRFVVDPQAGLVAGPCGVCHVEWHEGPGWLHCLACAAPEGRSANLLWRVEPLWEAEPGGDPQPLGLESRCARELARRLLAEAGFGGADLRREERGASRPGPPLVVVEGPALENVQVSLSHDGAWVAAAVAWW